MTTAFSASDTVGFIVAKFPQAAETFRQYGIDFCCGGQKPLADASREHGIDETSLLTELTSSYNQAVQQGSEITDWSVASQGDLVHHVITAHHAYLRQVFPPMTELTAKILRVHGKNHGDSLSQVHRLFNLLRMDMEQHMIAEEENVFPQIIDYEHVPTPAKLTAVVQEIADLHRDHDATADLLKQLRAATDDYAVPEDACGTYAYVFEKLASIEADILTHIHKENNILFARLQKKAAGRN